MSTKTIVVVAFCLAVSGCDFSPTEPFGGFHEEGARLTGSFTSGSVAAAAGSLKSRTASAASAADALTVVVYDLDGNELGSVDVVDGAFSLRGLPESFVLVFQDESGNALGDPMTFEGVAPNQEVEIVVDLVDGEVVLIEEKRTGIGHPGDGIEIEGLAQNVTFDASNAMNGSLDVNGYHVISRAAETTIRKGNRSLTLADLEAGDRVHVRGVFEGGDVLAHEIKLQNEGEEDEGTVAACDYRDPAKSNHILVCHKGKTLSISPEAWPGHAGHGDTCGPCLPVT
jgi:Domain of unknown function (DUF5666)